MTLPAKKILSWFRRACRSSETLLLEEVGQDTFNYICDLINDFENSHEELILNRGHFYYELYQILKDSHRDSRSIGGKNINYYIYQYLCKDPNNNEEVKKGLIHKMYEYLNRGHDLVRYSRMFVIAILLNFNVNNEGKFNIYERVYSLGIYDDNATLGRRARQINHPHPERDIKQMTSSENIFKDVTSSS